MLCEQNTIKCLKTPWKNLTALRAKHMSSADLSWHDQVFSAKRQQQHGGLDFFRFYFAEAYFHLTVCSIVLCDLDTAYTQSKLSKKKNKTKKTHRDAFIVCSNRCLDFASRISSRVSSQGLQLAVKGDILLYAFLFLFFLPFSVL